MNLRCLFGHKWKIASVSVVVKHEINSMIGIYAKGYANNVEKNNENNTIGIIALAENVVQNE
ncbi:MAG: hypothetical protein LBL90_13750 [Prevotellaceae bacterium]|jgi:hypothetical protein|nr:hypothetical protein [Prevotellaceae bacterium]